MTAHDIRRIEVRSGAEIQEVIDAGEPVVLRGLMDGCSLNDFDSLEKFVQAFGDSRVTVSRNDVDAKLDAIRAHCRNETRPSPEEQEESTVAAYVEEFTRRPDTARLITEQPADARLLRHIELPPALRELGVERLLPGETAGSETEAGCWWFMANAGNASDLHTDWDGCHVLNHQVFGRKRWILFPQHAAGRLGAYDIYPTVRVRDMSEEQLHELLAYSSGSQVVLEPGETIYVPPFYYHHADYVRKSMGFALRMLPPTGKIRKLIAGLHRSPALQNVFTFMLQDSRQAELLLPRLTEVDEADYPSALHKYRAVEDVAQSLCRKCGLLEDYWQLPPGLFLEQVLAGRYERSSDECSAATVSSDGDDLPIRTESLCSRDRALESTQIDVGDDKTTETSTDWIDENTATETVESLLHPLSLEDFFSEHFERSWLRIERGDGPRPHENLYGVDDLLEDFRRQRIPLHSVKFSKRTATGNVSLPLQQFSLGPVVAADATDRPPSAMLYEPVADYFRDETGSVVVYRIEQFVSQINELVSELGEALRTKTQTNAYYTPRAGKTLDLHWDTHDVIVLQLEGRKHWQVCDSLIPLPLEGRDYMASDSFEGYGDVLDSETFVLEPGDFLYMPRGVPHRAWTEETASLHLTVGLQHPTWLSVFKSAAVEALRHCEKQLPFRRTCPAVFTDSASGDQETFRELLAEFAEQLAGVDLRRLVSRETCVPPLIAAPGRDAVVEPSTALKKVSCVHFRHVADDGAELEFHGKRMTFGPAAAEAVAYVTSHRRFRVGDLPGLSPHEQCLLATRLLQEGFLSTVDDVGRRQSGPASIAKAEPSVTSPAVGNYAAG